MKNNQSTSERGQALILIVVGMVVLLGFTALAVDGGMVYADRRNVQNAADAASLAGGGAAAAYMENFDIKSSDFKCSTMGSLFTDAKTEAINRAADNDFTIVDSDTEANRVQIVCNDVGWNRYIDVHVFLTADTRTSFIHFVYPGPLRNSVTSITRVRPKTPFAFGNAIVALNQSACSGNQNGIIFSGSVNVDVTAGGVFTNGCLTGNGNSGGITVSPPTAGIGYAGAGQINHEENFSPTPVLVPGGPISPEMLYIAPPPCPHSGGSDTYKNGASGQISPGNYTAIKANGAITLVAGGLYCITEGDFNIGNNNLTIDTSNGKSGVTIYIDDNSFITNGGGKVVLNSPPDDPSMDVSPALPGILFYLNGTSAISGGGSACEVKLTGNGSSFYDGIVYAPGCNIVAGGGSDLKGINSQLIGYNVNVNGGPDLDITYSANKKHGKPTLLELYK